MMQNPHGYWHFPRTELANQYLDKLDMGMDQGLTLLERRRYGKSEFILRDLMPCAADRGYLPIYVSMTDNAAAPHLALMRELEETCEKLEPLWKRLIARFKFKLSVKTPHGITAEAEVSGIPRQVTPDEITRIHALFDRLAGLTDKRVLLLMDEIQHLTNKQFLPFSHALKNELDRKRGKMVALFVGSTATGLRMNFNREFSPFFGFGVQMPFPYLKNEFVQFIGQRFLESTKRPLGEPGEVQQYFNKLDRNPEYFLNMVSSMQLNPMMPLEKAYLITREKMATEDHFEEKFAQMKDIDHLVYNEIAAHTWKLNQTNREERYSRALNTRVDEDMILKSLGRLRHLGLISPAEGGFWLNEAIGFRRWIQDRVRHDQEKAHKQQTLAQQRAADGGNVVSKLLRRGAPAAIQPPSPPLPANGEAPHEPKADRPPVASTTAASPALPRRRPTVLKP